jgi:hypothetical protein
MMNRTPNALQENSCEHWGTAKNKNGMHKSAEVGEESSIKNTGSCHHKTHTLTTELHRRANVGDGVRTRDHGLT